MPAGRPAWADEPIRVVPSDEVWPEHAARLIEQLERTIGDLLADGPHHVGSTAVAGLPAKPTLDLLCGIDDLLAPGPADRVTAALERLGWHLVPPSLDRRAWRRLFVLPENERRVAHLHLVAVSHPRYAEALAFRDLLRRDEAVRDAYGALKGTLAQAYVGDREAYTEAKGHFIAEALATP